MVDLDNASQDVGSVSLAFKDQTEKNFGRWVGMIARYPVIVTLGEFSGKAIASTRNHFPDRDWAHFHLVHPSGLNRKLNDPKEHEFAVALLKQAYAKFLTLRVSKGKVER